MINKKINLGYLLAIAKDDISFLQKTVESMIVQTTQLIAQLKAQAAKNDSSELAASIHACRPGIKLMGASFLDNTLNDLEEALTTRKNSDNRKVLVHKLVTELEVLLPELILEKEQFSKP
jgi:hypothetical protein